MLKSSKKHSRTLTSLHDTRRHRFARTSLSNKMVVDMDTGVFYIVRVTSACVVAVWA
jgi:hypothetical protein